MREIPEYQCISEWEMGDDFPMSIGRTPTRRNATARKVLRKTTPSVESLRTRKSSLSATRLRAKSPAGASNPKPYSTPTKRIRSPR